MSPVSRTPVAALRKRLGGGGWGAGAGGRAGGRHRQSALRMRVPRSCWFQRRAKPRLSAAVEAALVVPPPQWGMVTTDEVVSAGWPPYTTRCGRATRGRAGPHALWSKVLPTRRP